MLSQLFGLLKCLFGFHDADWIPLKGNWVEGTKLKFGICRRCDRRMFRKRAWDNDIDGDKGEDK